MDNFMLELAFNYIKKNKLNFQDFGVLSELDFIKIISYKLQCVGCGTIKNTMDRCLYCGNQ